MTTDLKMFLLSKITSKKLWAFAASVMVAVMVFLGAPTEAVNAFLAVVGTTGATIVYIRAEAAVDVARAEQTNQTSNVPPGNVFHAGDIRD